MSLTKQSFKYQQAAFDRINFIPVKSRIFRDKTSFHLDLLGTKYSNLNDKIRNYSQFKVTQSEEGRADIISKRFYETEELWWVVCYYNGIVNPILDLVPGLTLKIPNYQELIVFLQNDTTKTSRIGTTTIL
jgi:hypothetical protein